VSDTDRLEEVRRELVRLGYLSHRFERFLLRDALVPHGGWSGLVRLALRGGCVVGALLGAVQALALAVANRAFASPLETIALALHVVLPTILGSGLGLLALLLAFRLWLARAPRRALGGGRLALAAAAALAVVGAGVAVGWPFLVELPRGARVAAAALAPLVAAGSAKLVADALLTLGIQLTRQVPAERLVRRRWIATSAVAAAGVLALGALALSPSERRREPPTLPTAPGVRVALVGVDGVEPDELDYRLASGALPRLSDALRRGGVVARYLRAVPATPAEVWTTVATGRAAADHGVRGIGGYRLLGMTTVMSRGGPWRSFWRWIAAPLGLAEQRPLLSGVRRAPAFWELVARGGRPILAVNWWGTYPAEPTAGLVVGHGAWEHLGVADPTAVWPESAAPALAALRTRLADESPARLATVTGLDDVDEATRQRLVSTALLPDEFHRLIAESRSELDDRALALYLPAIDLAAAARPGDVVLERLVDHELAALDLLVGKLVAGTGVMAIVFDPGRRGGGEGRVVVLAAGCAAAARPSIDLRSVAATLLRAAGLPQSAELPQPVDFCPWPAPPERIPTYGERRTAPGSAAAENEYLETLRSLGYL